MECYQKDYLFRLTDDTGILQHGKYDMPDPRYGYTTDDNARALILAAGLCEEAPGRGYEKLLYRYAGFLLGAQKENGRFRNFMGYDRCWLERDGSEDCQGRSCWGIAAALVSPGVPLQLKKMLGFLLARALPNLRALGFVKSQAYALLGCSLLLAQGREAAFSAGWAAENGTKAEIVSWPQLQMTGAQLAAQLQKAWQETDSKTWRWFESSLTYSNALVPWSLLLYGRAVKEAQWQSLGLAALDFLAGKTMRDGMCQPVGCRGWWPETAKKGAVYDQQPLEAFEMLAASQEAWHLTGEMKYKQWAKAAFDWYKGRNTAGQSLLEPVSGGCYDGITAEGVNENQGAESQIAWGLAWLFWHRQ